MGNPGEGGESQLTAKKLLIFPTRKFLSKFTLSTIKSGIASPSNSNFHLITLYIQASFVAVGIAVISFVLTLGFRLYVHICRASFDKSMFTECCL